MFDTEQVYAVLQSMGEIFALALPDISVRIFPSDRIVGINIDSAGAHDRTALRLAVAGAVDVLGRRASYRFIYDLPAIIVSHINRCYDQRRNEQCFHEKLSPSRKI